jgi:hypothetical protein
MFSLELREQLKTVLDDTKIFLKKNTESLLCNGSFIHPHNKKL